MFPDSFVFLFFEAEGGQFAWLNSITDQTDNTWTQ